MDPFGFALALASITSPILAIAYWHGVMGKRLNETMGKSHGSANVREKTIAKPRAFDRIKAGFEDAIAFVNGDETRATLHVFSPTERGSYLSQPAKDQLRRVLAPPRDANGRFVRRG